ncbi:MBL fold metallo-hydrolase [uncultured Winogradskyella sp.]|uniref:MBL fold metallo-hydrolase n=1 Tax=uncultured Winogradskyella sp. TaxID=395353 RepID=UPI002610711D|nr:MBL fold metallo-hydrolase [uncultured Winogradskyella sp.]
MKLLKSTLLLAMFITLSHCKDQKQNPEGLTDLKTTNIEDSVKVIPITHGTLILETGSETIYIDPTGGMEAFKDQKAPTLVLITDIHGDHLSKKTLETLNLNNVTLIGPRAVTEKLPSYITETIVTINNGDIYKHNAVKIEAIPMYNLREDALKFHVKGRGNGYILTINEERIYISGDTEDIPEMRNLKNIDKAFVCMNMPWTMSIEQAADAVLEFKPKIVYPYHYRGSEKMSNVSKFKNLVENDDKSIEIRLLDWY